jgi:lanosterol synthase
MSAPTRPAIELDKPRTGPATDLEKWRLVSEGGRQTWFYDEDNSFNRSSNFIERHSLGLDTSKDAPELPRPGLLSECLLNGMRFYSKLQAEDGHWCGDYGGPLFLMSGLVIVCHVTKTSLEETQKLEMIRYLRNVQNKDGGWGLHVAGKSTVFGTASNYVAFRLLGVGPDDDDAVRARGMLHKLGEWACEMVGVAL